MRWLTVAEAAREIHKRNEKVYEITASGELKAYKDPATGRILIHVDDLDEYVRTQYRPAMCENAARRVLAGVE